MNILILSGTFVFQLCFERKTCPELIKSIDTNLTEETLEGVNFQCVWYSINSDMYNLLTKAPMQTTYPQPGLS